MSFLVRGVCFSYKSAPVLNNVDADIPANQTTAIMGVSGVGKSTLLGLLGLLWQGRLPAGEIVCRETGESLYSLSVAEQARRRRQDFGFIFQNSPLLPSLTCAENIELPLVLQGMPAEQRRAREQAVDRGHTADERTGQVEKPPWGPDFSGRLSVPPGMLIRRATKTARNRSKISIISGRAARRYRGRKRHGYEGWMGRELINCSN